MAKRIFHVGAVVLATLGAGCAQTPTPRSTAPAMNVGLSTTERTCLARAMYFEARRNSEDGMLAVGTVVQNRLRSGRYGSSYCDVVGQKGQFAPGVLTRPMQGEAAERAGRVADQIASGRRHPAVRNAMFFHTAGLRFPYPNMRYVLVAGGNAFYEKRSVISLATAAENARSRAIALAYAKTDSLGEGRPIMLASLTRNIAMEDTSRRR